MTPTKVIFGVDDSHFLDFWPLQSKICKQVLGLEPVLFYISDEDSDFYYDDYGLVKKIKKVENCNTGLLACIVRMWATRFFPEEVCIMGDLDLFMINKEFTVDRLSEYSDEDLIIFASDGYDLERPEVQQMFVDAKLPFVQQMYNYPYTTAKGKTFNKILNTSVSLEEFVNFHRWYKEGYRLMWLIDEFYFSDCVNTKNHGVNVVKLKRGVYSHFITHRRIERHNFPVKLKWEREIQNQELHGVYEVEKLISGYYLDVNCVRPYKDYKEEIDKLVDIVVNHSMIQKPLKPLKKIALVSSYCDTQEKKDILYELINDVKKIGVDVMVISPIPLTEKHLEASDYIFFTKENPILTYPIRLFTFWKKMPLPDGRICTLHCGVKDYGWAALYHVKKLSQIALNYDYDVFYHMIYDLEIDDKVKWALENFEGNMLYPRRDPNNPETIWETTLHFMSFDRTTMNIIENEITLDNYLSTNGVAEGEVLKWKNKFNLPGSNHPVRDKIYYWKDHDFFNHSPIEDFKFFLGKTPERDVWLGNNSYATKLPANLRIVFHEIKESIKVNFVVNEIVYEFSPTNWEYVEFPILSHEVKSIEFVYKNTSYDLIKTYDEISINQIFYDHN